MEQSQLNMQQLIDTPWALVADDKCLLAMDESNPCNKRLAWLGIPMTVEARRALVVVDNNIPSRGCLETNAHALARYAALCQKSGHTRLKC